MFETLYIEQSVFDHPRSMAMRKRFSRARVIPCKSYSEVFNRKAQNFRLQKLRPALVLAKKNNNFVLEAPLNYSIGSRHNYYFSHMLNCIYDCRYCFLQGMFDSANYILFVNYEDFTSQIEEIVNREKESVCFFSGYDCDSLALEPLTGFINHTLPLFRKLENALLELRTKSVQISGLLDLDVMHNCVVAFSLAPESLVRALELKTPSLLKRLDAIETLQRIGWPIGLRFDPVIFCDNYRTLYDDLFDQVFMRVDSKTLHSVSLGLFRIPQKFHQKMVKLYPDEKMFAGALSEKKSLVSYKAEIEKEMLDYCREKMTQFVPEHKLFICHDPN